ncbi:extracellular solute-binding protein [Microbacterium sp. SORGH_AS_0888]|uniref:extracellular solute-binding protein n=1 Tax=Microbacterium sp. SORGH_AS_0888 TaxID=3041791 RepID=UPI0027831174|nr:extracellular solute-binding protein [Microbacterium sp. SORGH_AS_0888]MDQ1129296.1 putative spermidine/putrescine transport system substrate-binding protein [Microbacterium sp. SORGH_AS_0888]
MSTILRTRRGLIAAVAIGAVAALATGCGSSASPESSSSGGGDALSGQVVWADYGGPTNESRQVAYFDGFGEKTGVDVVSTSIEDSVYYGMLEGGSGDYDIFQVGAAEVLNYSGNVEELTDAAQGDLLPDTLRPYMAAGFYIGIGQGWLTATFPNGGPQNWADFFDTQKFPGKRAWPGAPGSYDSSYEIALLADGVAPEDLYPLDIARATKKLDSIRGDLVFYQSYPEVQQLLTSGSASIAVSVTGQFTALRNAGQDVTVQYNQLFITPNGFVIPKTSNNPKAAMALAEYINDPKNQAVFAKRTGYGPVNSAVFDELSADDQKNLVNAPAHADQVLHWDEQWRADNKDKLLDAYTAWLAG